VARVAPRFDLKPECGQVVVTRFECRSLSQLVRLLFLHVLVKREVRRRAEGLVASKAHVDWRRRTLLSISLWNDLDSVYSMGMVPAHVAASRLPRQAGVRTACGVFCFAGDWRFVMFGGGHVARSPLRPLPPDAEP
jgi:hypothetical protein